jgi:outer membrane immunogenic protein
MKKLLLGSALSLCMVAGASAADMYAKAPAPPVWGWTGFYVGADIGGAWDRQDWATLPSAAANQFPLSGTLSGSSVIGGVYAGYNFSVAPNLVVGVEGDFSWTHLDDSATGPNMTAAGGLVPTGSVNLSRNLNWLASARGRAGFTVTPNALVYVTGGAAWGGTSYSASDIFQNGCPNNCVIVSPFSSTASGYVVGGGLEWAFNRNWLLRGEYLYYRLPGATAATVNPVVNFTWGDLTVNTARAGLTYKF